MLLLRFFGVKIPNYRDSDFSNCNSSELPYHMGYMKTTSDFYGNIWAFLSPFHHYSDSVIICYTIYVADFALLLFRVIPVFRWCLVTGDRGLSKGTFHQALSTQGDRTVSPELVPLSARRSSRSSKPFSIKYLSHRKIAHLSREKWPRIPTASYYWTRKLPSFRTLTFPNWISSVIQS